MEFMTKIKNIKELHYLLILFDDFRELEGRKPKNTWLDEVDEVYNIEYEDGFLFTAPKDLIDILYDGAYNDKNPIVNNIEADKIINVL